MKTEPLQRGNYAHAKVLLYLGANFRAFFYELCGLSFQASRNSFVLGHTLFRCIAANVFCDFHAAKVRTAHETEMRGLSAFLRQGFVVELARIPQLLIIRREYGAC